MKENSHNLKQLLAGDHQIRNNASLFNKISAVPMIWKEAADRIKRGGGRPIPPCQPNTLDQGRARANWLKYKAQRTLNDLYE
jgi:hypothetical protein